MPRDWAPLNGPECMVGEPAVCVLVIFNFPVRLCDCQAGYVSKGDERPLSPLGASGLCGLGRFLGLPFLDHLDDGCDIMFGEAALEAASIKICREIKERCLRSSSVGKVID